MDVMVFVVEVVAKVAEEGEEIDTNPMIPRTIGKLKTRTTQPMTGKLFLMNRRIVFVISVQLLMLVKALNRGLSTQLQLLAQEVLLPMEVHLKYQARSVSPMDPSQVLRGEPVMPSGEEETLVGVDYYLHSSRYFGRSQISLLIYLIFSHIVRKGLLVYFGRSRRVSVLFMPLLLGGKHQEYLLTTLR